VSGVLAHAAASRVRAGDGDRDAAALALRSRRDNRFPLCGERQNDGEQMVSLQTIRCDAANISVAAWPGCGC